MSVSKVSYSVFFPVFSNITRSPNHSNFVAMLPKYIDGMEYTYVHLHMSFGREN
jgi:hypothetical protein